MNVLIIEDEPYAQNELKRLLERIEQDIHVLDMLDSIEESINWLKSNDDPDLIFMDIQLSDGLSFEIFNNLDIKSPVVFTTAFNEYAIKAFKVNSIDYLLKPIRQSDLENAISKYKTLVGRYHKAEIKINLEQIEQLLKINNPVYKSRFVIKFGDQIKHIDVSEVAYFNADENEVMLITKSNQRYVLDFTLNQLESSLDPARFYRINRSYIVSVDSIHKINKYFNSRLHLELLPETAKSVLISRVNVNDFLNWMDK